MASMYQSAGMYRICPSMTVTVTGDAFSKSEWVLRALSCHERTCNRELGRNCHRQNLMRTPLASVGLREDAAAATARTKSEFPLQRCLMALAKLVRYSNRFGFAGHNKFARNVLGQQDPGQSMEPQCHHPPHLNRCQAQWTTRRSVVRSSSVKRGTLIHQDRLCLKVAGV